jgi:hypothetical protein
MSSDERCVLGRPGRYPKCRAPPDTEAGIERCVKSDFHRGPDPCGAAAGVTSHTQKMRDKLDVPQSKEWVYNYHRLRNFEFLVGGRNMKNQIVGVSNRWLTHVEPEASNHSGRRVISNELRREWAMKSSEGGRATCNDCGHTFAMYYIQMCRVAAFTDAFLCTDCRKARHL